MSAPTVPQSVPSASESAAIPQLAATVKMVAMEMDVQKDEQVSVVLLHLCQL